MRSSTPYKTKKYYYYYSSVRLRVRHLAPPQVADRGRPSRYGGYRAIKIPGADQKPAKGRVPEKNPGWTEEMSREPTKLPRAGTGNGNPAVGSDRVKAPVAGAHRPTDSGGDDSRDMHTVPLLQVEGLPIARSGSQTSLLSVSSAVSARSATSNVSAFSNMTADDITSCNKDWEEIVAIRNQQEENINRIKSEVRAMMDSCSTQKNVNMTIKDGLKNALKWLDLVQGDHAKAREMEERYQRGLVYTQEGQDARKRIRRTIQGQLTRSAVLASEAVHLKRTRDPEKDSPEQKKEKKRLRQGRKGAEPEVEEKRTAESWAPARLSKNKLRKSSVLIKIGEGQSYADVLGKLRREVNPDTSRTTVLGARTTGRGDVLIELSGNSDKTAFTADLRRVVGDLGEVRADHKKVTLEIRDLDPLVNEEEVKVAVRAALQDQKINLEVKVLNPNRRGLKLAVVVLAEEEALRLERLLHVRIGFTSCRIRRRIAVTRCYRCLEFGHVKRNCKKDDRSSTCYKCGEADHLFKDCKEKPQCFLCKREEPAIDCGHVSGSGACAVFRRALQSEKNKERWRPKQPSRQ